MKYYIGLDTHSTTPTAVVVKECGEQVLRETFPTTEANLVKFIRKIPGEKHLTFEECTLAQWLNLTLREEVNYLLVCNPVFVAKKPAKFVGDSLFSQIEILEGMKEKYKIYFHKNKQRYRSVKNLCSIPGIDIVRANIIVAIV